MQKFKRVAANEKVCQLLEAYLERAKQGKMDFAGIIATEGGNYSADFVGDVRAYYVGYFAVDDLREKIRAGRISVQSTELEASDAPSNMYIYNLSEAPPCFDFVAWIVTATLRMARDHIEGPLRVGFLRRSDEEAYCGTEGVARRLAFFDKVITPAMELFGAVSDPLACHSGRTLRTYALKEAVDAAEAGETIPRIRIPQRYSAIVAAHLKGSRPVTITLRETDIWEHRNSNIEAWTSFAAWLQERGERVIFLRDTAKADEPLDGFETLSSASKDLLLRAAIYERAKCNLFVSNGPAILANFGMRPWLMFVTCDDDEKCHCNTPQWWRDFQGIGPGEQFPWSGHKQRIVWKDDSFENIRDAWEQYIAKPKEALCA